MFLFKDCLFQLRPLNRYYAQKAYSKEKANLLQTKTFSQDEQENLLKLKAAAENEKAQNARETQRVFGTVITYGQTVQLFHMKSESYVTVKKKLPAVVEKNASKIELDQEGNQVRKS